MTATQTMEIVYGLFKNMKEVMDGMDAFAKHFLHNVLKASPSRWKGIDG